MKKSDPRVIAYAGVFLQQLWIPDISYWILQKPLLLQHIWFSTSQEMALPSKGIWREKNQERVTELSHFILLFKNFIIMIIIFHFPPNVIRFFEKSLLSIRLYHSTWQPLSGERWLNISPWLLNQSGLACNNRMPMTWAGVASFKDILKVF